MVLQFHLLLLLLPMGSSWDKGRLPMVTVEQHLMAARLDLTSVQMVLQYHLLLLLLPMGWSWDQECLPMVTVEQRQMVYLLDQMSVPMDLLWHLHLQWQPLPAQLLWLQMGSL